MVPACSTVAFRRRRDGTVADGLALSPKRLLSRNRPKRDPVMPHVENDQIVETATEARAGVRGHKVNYVLVISTAAVKVLFAAIYMYFLSA
jgi:hypothetical protein